MFCILHMKDGVAAIYQGTIMKPEYKTFDIHICDI